MMVSEDDEMIKITHGGIGMKGEDLGDGNGDRIEERPEGARSEDAQHAGEAPEAQSCAVIPASNKTEVVRVRPFR